MSFAQTIFQKDIYSITLADVENFFLTEQEENAILEFKSGGVELEAIYREVAAFLNSEGGMLIVGTPKEEAKSGKKLFFGSLIPSKISNKDVLMRSIGSNISPSPYGIKVQSISHKDGNIYIIEVPQSIHPPHQVNREGKYYIRLESEAKPAPHGIVESLFFKRQKPNLTLQIHAKREAAQNHKMLLQFEFQNLSSYSAENLGFFFYVDGIHNFRHFTDKWQIVPTSSGEYKYEGKPLANGVLVNGISQISSFVLSPSSQYVLLDCSYWCRDIDARRIITVVDFFNGNQIKAFYDSLSETSQSKNEVYEFYFLKVQPERKDYLMSKGWNFSH